MKTLMSLVKTMNKTKAQVFEAMKKLAIIFGNEGIQQNQLIAYTEFLVEELSYLEIKTALTTIAKTSKRFPSIAEIVEVARGTSQDKAMEVCAEIIKAIHEYGFYRGKEAALALGESWQIVEGVGGWNYICSLSNNELGILRAQMRDLARAKINKAGFVKGFEKIAFSEQQTLLVSNDEVDT